MFSFSCFVAASAFVSHTVKAHNFKSPEPLKLCWESELKPPYLMQDEQGELYGIAVDWLAQIMDKRNIPYQNLLMPWKRCLLNLERGHVDLVPNSSFKQSRSVFSYYSDELYRTHLAFFYLKDKHPNAHTFNQIVDFKDFKIGGIRGFNYSFYDGLITLDQGANNRRALIRKLKRGRVDFAILQAEVIASIYQNEQYQLDGITSILAPSFTFKPFFVLVSRAHNRASEIIEQFNDGLNELKESGQYQQIQEKYLK
jgi:polar amino acid transport system substrate-binding protein